MIPEPCEQAADSAEAAFALMLTVAAAVRPRWRPLLGRLWPRRGAS